VADKCADESLIVVHAYADHLIAPALYLLAHALPIHNTPVRGAHRAIHCVLSYAFRTTTHTPAKDRAIEDTRRALGRVCCTAAIRA